MIKRPAACQSDAEPTPKKPKTKPPTAPATMDEPASTWKEAKKALRTARSGCRWLYRGGVNPNMPLGAFPGVPKRGCWRPREYKDFRIYTDMRATQWKVKRNGSSEIPPDAHDNYLFCGTTAYRYHRIFLGLVYASLGSKLDARG